MRAKRPGGAGDEVGVGEAGVRRSDCWIPLEAVMKARGSEVVVGVVRAWAAVREKRERSERVAAMAGWMELVVRWVRGRRLRG